MKKEIFSCYLSVISQVFGYPRNKFGQVFSYVGKKLVKFIASGLLIVQNFLIVCLLTLWEEFLFCFSVELNILQFSISGLDYFY